MVGMLMLFCLHSLQHFPVFHTAITANAVSISTQTASKAFYAPSRTQIVFLILFSPQHTLLPFSETTFTAIVVISLTQAA